jgi:DNA-binding winged helix-turn-helix (wHTH) protein
MLRLWFLWIGRANGSNPDKIAGVSYTFGPFELDTRAGELRRNGQRVPVTPKVFRLLLFLVQNAGRLIPKREILDKIWGDTNVAEGSVARTVTNLRFALNDKPSSPEYLRTEARRGYRFVATVQQTPDTAPISSSFEVIGGSGRYPLIEGDNVLGRADDCDVSLKLDSISRHHAAITVAGTRVTIRDLQSKNGTFVSGRRIDGTMDLRDGDDIRLGSVALMFRLIRRDPSTVTEEK